MSSCSFRPLVWAGGFIAVGLLLAATQVRATTQNRPSLPLLALPLRRNLPISRPQATQPPPRPARPRNTNRAAQAVIRAVPAPTKPSRSIRRSRYC